MLTVCIPYRNKDALFYNRLIVVLNKYAEGYPVQFMSLPNDGTRSIGQYRQQLLDNVDEGNCGVIFHSSIQLVVSLRQAYSIHGTTIRS